MSLFREITGPLYPLLDWPMNSGPNGGYALCSGIGLGALGLGAWWRGHNCHVHRCPRLSWHPHPEHGHPVCKKHHPDDPRNLVGEPPRHEPTQMSTNTDITLTFTPEEAQAIAGALDYVTGYYGAAPDPPTPAMTAKAKIATALGWDGPTKAPS